jgi:hypothetical protein
MSNHRNHTPGPWHVAPEGPGDDLRVAVGAGEAIAHITVIGREDIANARLIAAAPDLLAALRSLVFLSPFAPSATGLTADISFAQIRLAQKAIDKATEAA